MTGSRPSCPCSTLWPVTASHKAVLFLPTIFSGDAFSRVSSIVLRFVVGASSLCGSCPSSCKRPLNSPNLASNLSRTRKTSPPRRFDVRTCSTSCVRLMICSRSTIFSASRRDTSVSRVRMRSDCKEFALAISRFWRIKRLLTMVHEQ